MEYLLSPNDVLAVDAATTDMLGIAPWTLMDMACEAATPIVESLLGPPPVRVLVASGRGNNGGDGFGIAWRLQAAGHNVRVVTDLAVDEATEASAVQMRRCVQEGMVYSWSDFEDLRQWQPQAILDALVGVGLSDSPRADVTRQLQLLETVPAMRIAVDVPSGLNSFTGHAYDHCFVADYTVTMAAVKVGATRGRGPDVCGTTLVADIGIPDVVMASQCRYLRHTSADVRRLLPRRTRRTTKFDYGRVVVIAGSRDMAGAASLTAEAALRTGAGLVHLVTPVVHPATPREVITHSVPMHDDGTIAEEAYEQIRRIVARATCIVTGPGIGTNEDTLAMIASVLTTVDMDVPLIVDADGLMMLRMLARHRNLAITPHCGEFARMLGIGHQQPHERWTELAQEYAASHRCIVHLKDVPAITTDGASVRMVTNGNPGMATAGSGDVLSGIIGGLAAQHVRLLDAASLGAYMHAYAGDKAAERSMEWMVAGDIIGELHHALV